jgi:hypothetical protein
VDFLAEGWRFMISGGDIPREQGPPFDARIELTARGSTPHRLAAAANGTVMIRGAEGRMGNSALRFLGADILWTILETLNPFVREEPYTTLECLIVGMNVIDGKAYLDGVAARTEKMTIIGSGDVDLRNERIDLSWTAKTRKGIGISAGTFTNPYIKLGGTLARPRLGIEPVSAVTSTGVAVATAGLSFLAKGLWDRVTAELKVCDNALEDFSKRGEKRRESAAKKDAGN